MTQTAYNILVHIERVCCSCDTYEQRQNAYRWAIGVAKQKRFTSLEMQAIILAAYTATQEH